MNEHDDDVEAEVDEDAEFETAAFPVLAEDEDAEPGEAEEHVEKERDIDPDTSEI